MGQERWSSLTVQLVKVMLEEILVPDSIEIATLSCWLSMGEYLHGLVRLGSSNHYGLEDPNSLVGTHHGLEGSLMYSVTEKLHATESHCMHSSGKMPTSVAGSPVGCSPTTTRAPFLIPATGSRCVIGVRSMLPRDRPPLQRLGL